MTLAWKIKIQTSVRHTNGRTTFTFLYQVKACAPTYYVWKTIIGVKEDLSNAR